MKKTGILIIVLALCLFLVSACTQNEAEPQTTDPGNTEAETVTITDVHGRSVTVPKNPQKIAISGLQTLSFAIVGELDKVCAVVNGSNYVPYFPELADKELAYINDDDTINMELLLNADPDVVFYRTASADDENIKLMEDAGFPVVCELGLTYEQQIQCITFIGEIFGEEATAKAEAFTTYYRDVYEGLQSKYADIPDEDRPTFIAMWSREAGNYRPAAEGNVNAEFMTMLGGKNAYDGEATIDANIEQMLEWDPDIIVFLTDKALYDTHLADPAFNQLKAVQNAQTYVTPLGVGSWSTPTPDNALTLQWMASILHPEDYADFDLAATVKDFYSTFYGIEMSDEEVAMRLQGENPLQ